MSLSHLSNIKRFTFQYQYFNNQGEILSKYVIFDNLLNGIKFIYTLKISNILASDEIFIYDKDTKKKLVKGNINSIYDAYLKTYPRPEYVHVDDFMINELALVYGMNLNIHDNPTFRQIMKINTNYSLNYLLK